MRRDNGHSPYAITDRRAKTFSMLCRANVRFGSLADIERSCPLYPQKRTFFEVLNLFAKCHKGTFRYSSDHLFGRKNPPVFVCFAGLPTNALCNSVTACAS